MKIQVSEQGPQEGWEGNACLERGYDVRLETRWLLLQNWQSGSFQLVG